MFEGATGALVKYVPAGPEQDELLGLLRMGILFKKQQQGKRPGILSRLVLTCAKRVGPSCSFASLLDELSLEAARRDLHGVQASPVEKVDRIWDLITIHTKRGREQIPFGTVRNHLTDARKILSVENHDQA